MRLALAAAALSAVLLWACSPSGGMGVLAWIALVPAAAIALGSPDARARRLAVPLTYALYLEVLLVPALPFGLARRQWADEPVLPILVGDSPVVFAAAVAVPLFALVLYALCFPQPLDAATPLVAVGVPAVTWTALDVLRVKFDPSGPWGPLFLTQHDTGLAGLAAFGGPWVLTFAVVVVNYAVALALVRKRRVAAATAAALAVAAALLAGPVLRGERPRAVAVAAIQPGYDTSEFEHPLMHHLRRENRDYELFTLDVIRDLTPLTREAARRGARVAVWPEAAVSVHPRLTPSVRAALSRLVRETRLALVAPYFIRRQAEGGAVVFRPDGTIARDQPKHRPMWFVGERGGNRAPARPVATGSGALGSMLGVDIQDPGVARALAARGAHLLSSSTHDWFQLAHQQRAFARLYAAALRRPLIRADWRYGSAIFGARGEMLADAGERKRRAVVVARVPKGGDALYERVGDVLAWGAVAVASGLWLLAVVRR